MRILAILAAVVAFAVPSAAFGFTPLRPVQLRRAGASSCVVRMGGFGKPSEAKDSKAPVKITGIPKKTLLNFGEVIKKGAKAYKVFARVKGEDKWYEVGEVASTPDSPDAVCTIHKRLALEYAVDLYIPLKPKAMQLELGYSKSGQGMDDVVVAQKIASANEDIGKDAHGFMPKERSVGMAKGLFNINGDKVAPSSDSRPEGGAKGINPATAVDRKGGG